MLVIEYNENNIYKYLRHFHHKFSNKKIGIFANQKLDSFFIQRIPLYPWILKNQYYYIINSIDENNVYNIISGNSIFSGIIFNLSDFNEDYFLSIYNFCIENGKVMYFINNNDCAKNLYNLQDEKQFFIREGSINDIE